MKRVKSRVTECWWGDGGCLRHLLPRLKNSPPQTEKLSRFAKTVSLLATNNYEYKIVETQSPTQDEKLSKFAKETVSPTANQLEFIETLYLQQNQL